LRLRLWLRHFFLLSWRYFECNKKFCGPNINFNLNPILAIKSVTGMWKKLDARMKQVLTGWSFFIVWSSARSTIKWNIHQSNFHILVSLVKFNPCSYTYVWLKTFATYVCIVNFKITHMKIIWFMLLSKRGFRFILKYLCDRCSQLEWPILHIYVTLHSTRHFLISKYPRLKAMELGL
jgi:hypothetical protein